MESTDKNENFDKSVKGLLLGLTIAFAILFVFGMTCIISKYISVNNDKPCSVFGLSVMEITNNENADLFSQGSRVVIASKNVDEIVVGDFVAYNCAGTMLNSDFFGQVQSISDDIFVVRALNAQEGVSISKDCILGVATTSSSFVCGVVQFLLSDWVIWLFVVIPCMALMACIVIWLLLRLSRNINNNTQQDVIKNQITLSQNQNESKESEKVTKNKVGKKSKNEVEGMEQLTINLDDLDTAISSETKTNDKQKQSKKVNYKDDNYLLKNAIKPKHKTKLKEIPNGKIEVAKPKSKKQGDDYIYEKLPPTDTNKPIKEMLDKVTKDNNENSSVSSLLDKMRKQE